MEKDETNTICEKIYLYDAKNQLLWDFNRSTHLAVNYEYDAGGNILNKHTYDYIQLPNGNWTFGLKLSTVSYAYGDANWKDKLTAYDGAAITYDAIGNPLEYRGIMDFTWENGRQLAQADIGNVTASYTYNPDGTRISKTVSGVRTDIFVDAGGGILGQKTGNSLMTFMYDVTGRRDGFILDGVSYYYTYNAQGDVTAIVNSGFQTVAEYTYDSWGKLLSITGSLAGTVGVSNPFRYRGYYYDNETSLYYLQSRYYDPETGRFINADGLVDNRTVGSQNLFAYCFNNPVNMEDYTGCYPGSADDYCRLVESSSRGMKDYLDAKSLADKEAAKKAEEEARRKEQMKAINNNSTNVKNPISGLVNVISEIVDKWTNEPKNSSNSSQNSAATTVNPSSALKFDANQNAIIQMAKESRAGLSMNNALILLGWANEYGINNHGPMSGHGNMWQDPHIKIKNIHIRLFPD